MRSIMLGLMAAGLVFFTAYADSTSLKVTVDGIQEGKPISPQFAFCTYDEKNHTKDGGNISPAISWSGAPKGTRSYAIIMHDTDVPTVFDDANQEGKVIAADLPRKDFYHWVLTDIPSKRTQLKKGEDSAAVNKKGKSFGRFPHGQRGVNDFGSFMKGAFAGYDGPCPPWNDAIAHHYHFTVYALSVPTLGLKGAFTGPQALKAMEGKILAKGTVTGLFSQNPEVLKIPGN